MLLVVTDRETISDGEAKAELGGGKEVEERLEEEVWKKRQKKKVGRQ